MRVLLGARKSRFGKGFGLVRGLWRQAKLALVLVGETTIIRPRSKVLRAAGACQGTLCMTPGGTAQRGSPRTGRRART